MDRYDTLPPLLVRADATDRIGSGHIMRCLAFAQAWRRRSGTVAFLSYCEHDALRQRIQSAGIGFVPLERPHPDPADLRVTLTLLEEHTNAQGLKQPRPWLVLDGYKFDAIYQQAIRSAGYRLLMIDDAAHQTHYHADMLLNQNVHAERLIYYHDSDTQLLLGTRYALLRPEFLAWRGWRREIRETACRVLVTLGGADPDNVTLRVIQALQQVDIDGLEVTVVLGPAYAHALSIFRYLQVSSKPGPVVRTFNVVQNALHMPELMARAEVALSAGGSTCWELAFMGLPTVMLVLADNQVGVAEGLQKAGVAVNLGWFEQVSTLHITQAVTSLCRNSDQRWALSCRGQQLVDGDGIARAMEVMLTL
jgi:UDP-2,4-diacetamido-2,4,6-trideoxy-beta-L-altropyranose hydrolase